MENTRDKITYRFEWDVLPIPDGRTAELEDGTTLEGPVLIESAMRVIKILKR